MYIMQVNYDRKKIIMYALAELLKELRGSKSQFMFASESDISTSIISNIERGLKDPQLTTVFKIAEACNISCDEFVKLLIKKLPKDFSLIEK